MENSKIRKEFLEYLGAKGYSEHTLAAYQMDLEQFLLFLESGETDYLSLTIDQAKQYVYYLYNQDYSSLTIARKLSSLRAFFDFLVLRKYLVDNTFSFVKFPKSAHALPTFLYEQEFDLLIESIDTTTELGIRDLALFELMFASGLRVSEICSIELKDIHVDARIMSVIGKGNKERRVLFNQKTALAISEYLRSSRPILKTKSFEQTEILFLNHLGQPLSARGVRYLLDKHAFKSPLTQKLHPHMLRHSFATFMLDKGASIRMIQELLGHQSLSSTQLYTQLSKEKLKQSMNESHPLASIFKQVD